MKAELCKTQVVLTFAYVDGCNAVFEEASRGVEDPSIGLAFTIERWNLMGSPSEVTVTVEVGDTLN